MDARLYNKVYSLAKPYSLQSFMKEKISKTLEEQRTKRVQLKSNLPKVNKDLFLKLNDSDASVKKKKANSTLLEDDRFGALFSDDRYDGHRFRKLSFFIHRITLDNFRDFTVTFTGS